MNAAQGANYFFDCHKVNSKKNTIKSQAFVMSRFCNLCGNRELESITVIDNSAVAANPAVVAKATLAKSAAT